MFRKEAALCQLWVGRIRSPTALENHTSDLQNPKMRIAAFHFVTAFLFIPRSKADAVGDPGVLPNHHHQDPIGFYILETLSLALRPADLRQRASGHRQGLRGVYPHLGNNLGENATLPSQGILPCRLSSAGTSRPPSC